MKPAASLNSFLVSATINVASCRRNQVRNFILTTSAANATITYGKKQYNWVWRSLVACLNGVQEAGGSNPLTQTTPGVPIAFEFYGNARFFMFILQRCATYGYVFSYLYIDVGLLKCSLLGISNMPTQLFGT